MVLSCIMWGLFLLIGQYTGRYRYIELQNEDIIQSDIVKKQPVVFPGQDIYTLTGNKFIRMNYEVHLNIIERYRAAFWLSLQVYS